MPSADARCGPWPRRNICTAQALLANLAAMYAVYHGPEGLRAIAQRVHDYARRIATSLHAAGHHIVHDSFFDTVVVRVPGQAGAIVERAELAGINLRFIDSDHIGISCDECTAEDSFLVVANAANSSTVYREIVSRASGFAAVVRDHTADTALIAVQGPAAADIICALVPDEHTALVTGLKYYSAAAAVVADADVLLARTGYTGEDGFELYVHNDRAVALWRALLDQTRACGGSPAGLACRDTLRLEAGMALYGHELTIDTNPYEAVLAGWSSCPRTSSAGTH